MSDCIHFFYPVVGNGPRCHIHGGGMICNMSRNKADCTAAGCANYSNTQPCIAPCQDCDLRDAPCVNTPAVRP